MELYKDPKPFNMAGHDSSFQQGLGLGAPALAMGCAPIFSGFIASTSFRA